MSFKIGMRTIKTTIAIALCAIIMTYFFNVSPFFACIGAIVAMDNSIGNSIKGILTRNIATIIGGIVGIAFGYMSNNVVFLSLGTIIVITLLSNTKYKHAIVPACIVYLAVVYLNINEGSLEYGLKRIFETVVGSGIGFAVNFLIVAPEENEI